MPRNRRAEEVYDVVFESENITKVCSQYLKNNYFEMAKLTRTKLECPVCMEEITQKGAFCLLCCGHHLCSSCWWYLPDPRRCPTCRG